MRIRYRIEIGNMATTAEGGAGLDQCIAEMVDFGGAKLKNFSITIDGTYNNCEVCGRARVAVDLNGRFEPHDNPATDAICEGTSIKA